MLTLLAALLTAPLARAQAEDVEFAGTAAPAEEPAKPEAHLTAEFGGTWATGNSVYYALNGSTAGSYKWSANKIAASAGVNMGRGLADEDGNGFLDAAERAKEMQKTAEKVQGELRYDRFFGERNSVYLLAGAFRDPFAGYDLRSHEQLGYSRVLTDTDSTDIKVELGFDWAQENYVEGIEPNYQDIYAARVLAAFSHKFTEGVAFTDTVEAYSNVVDLEDVRVLNTASLTSQINTVFSLKLSNQLTFDNVPVVGFEKLDQTTMVTLVASIL